jgi:channel protein (hemolysin III family)
VLPDLYHLPSFYEPVSALSHLFGALVFLVLGCLVLWRGRGDRARLFLLGVYTISGVLLFSVSGVYHMLEHDGTARRVMARLDHAAIFGLIAGTFTAAHGIPFRGVLRWGPLAFIWIAAITGITLKTIFFDDMARGLGLLLYVTLGWFGIVSAFFVMRRFGLFFIMPVFLGGLAYTIGGVLDLVQWPIVVPGFVHPHEVFHLTVLLAAWFHWRFVWEIAGGGWTMCPISEQRPASPKLNRAVPDAIASRDEVISVLPKSHAICSTLDACGPELSLGIGIHGGTRAAP